MNAKVFNWFEGLLKLPNPGLTFHFSFRAPFEIYIGNYPVRFRENDVRKLFEEHDVTVTTIRLKHDGHKV